MWTLAKVLNGFADLQNERFHTFAIKKNGVVVGQLKFTSRPKNAGGPAWQAILFKCEYDMDVSYFGKNKNEVLEWVKNDGNTRLERGLVNG